MPPPTPARPDAKQFHLSVDELKALCHQDKWQEALSTVLSILCRDLGGQCARFYVSPNKEGSALEAQALNLLLSHSSAPIEHKAFSNFSWFMPEPLLVDGVSEAPPSAQAEFALCKEQLWCSSIYIPLWQEDSLLAVLCLHGAEARPEWSRELERLLGYADFIYQHYLARHESPHKAFLQTWARRLLDADNLMTINEALQELSLQVGADGSNLLIMHRPSQVLRLIYSSASMDDEGRREGDVSLEAMPYLAECYLSKNKPAVAHDFDFFDESDPRAVKERAMLEGLEQPSFIMNAELFEGQINGFLEVHTQGRERHWSDYDVELVERLTPLLFACHQRIKLSQARSESLGVLRQVIQVTGIGYAVLSDSEDTFSCCLASMLGYPEDTVIDRQQFFGHFKTPAEYIRAREWFHLCLHDIQPPLTIVLQCLDESLIHLYCQALSYSRKDQGGENCIVVGFIDITAQELQKEQKQELLLARLEADKANAANQAKSDFLARMSHEIRTPMNGVIGLTHLVQGTQLNAIQEDYLRHIEGSSQKLLRIINDILDFSKIEAGVLKLETADFYLDEMFDELNQTFKSQLQEKKLAFTYELDADIPQRIHGDALRLHQILTNLVGNAIKFTEFGEVSIHVFWLGGFRLRFSVRDSGIGIEPSQQKALFGAFSQVDVSTTRHYGGTGLGLGICKRLINLMGGDIQLRSTPGLGTCIDFDLRLEAPKGHVDAYQPLERQRILVVDDNEVSRSSLLGLVRSLGLEAEAVSNGQSTIERLAQKHKPISVVLMDYVMPGMNGMEAAALIKQDESLQPSPEILMVSGYDHTELLESRGARYIDGYLTKPICRSSLHRALAQACEHAKQKSAESKAKLNEVSEWLALEGIRVLLVEDNVVNQKVASGILKKQGVNVTVANNGQEAVDIIRTDTDFVLIIMDLEMPKMDGFEATRIILDVLQAEIPIVALTAHVVDGYEKRCYAAGMCDYLTKPVKPQQLYACVEKWMRKVNVRGSRA